MFPDPKYYMIGFTLSHCEESHEEDLDPNISQEISPQKLTHDLSMFRPSTEVSAPSK